MPTGCFVSTGRSFEQAVSRVKLADLLGYDAAFVTHIAGRESLTIVIDAPWRAGTGRRSSTRSTRCGSTRASSARFSAVKNLAGKKWQTRFHLTGLEPRPGIPIFIAGLSPAMLRLAGEIGDGVMLWLCTPSYIREVVIPAVREGRGWAGRTLEGFEVVAAVPGALTEQSAAYAAIRGALVTYFALPFYRRCSRGRATARTSRRSTPHRAISTRCAPRSRVTSWTH